MAEYVFESKPAIIDQDRSLILRVALIGAMVGLVSWILAYILQRFVLSTLLCGGNVTCDKSISYAGATSLIIMSVVAVIALVKQAVYRPLLIVLGALISLWGINSWLSGLTILEQIGWMMLLFALAYSIYSWIARIRNVPIMLILILVVVIATRIVPTMV